jgi:hypothetical protein
VTAAVAHSAGIVQKGDAGQVAAAACKLWPYDGRTILAAIAFGTDDPALKMLVVAMVDAGSGRVLSRFSREIGEDAAVHVGDNSLAIDTAPYQLAQDVRAFGVRFTSDARGASCADGIWSDELTLFVRAGATLRPVLQGLAMSRSEARKGCFGQSDGLVYDEAKLALALAGTSSHGLADLVVSARIARESAAGGALGKPKTEQATLRYDGNAYRGAGAAPWWLAFFP